MAIVFRVGDPMDTSVTAEAAAQSVSTIGNPVQRNKHMLFNERLSDVFFSVGAAETAKKIPAHTFLLSQASDVFQTMFSENWKNDKPVQVVDFEAPTFCSLLRWIYCEELIFPPGMLVDVMKIAHKYMVHSLTSFVTNNLEKYVWSLHGIATELEMPDLVQKSMDLIKSNEKTHMASADFLNASCGSITAFVSQDRTAVTDLQIFTRCLQWSEKECERRGLEVQPVNQRLVMEPFIYQISFESMTAAELDTKYVWSFHTMAIELEMADLTEKSFNLIKSDQATLLASADFLNASCASVTAFVSLDRTAVTDLQIFTRCLDWSEKECERRGLEVLPANQRMVMEKFIYEISFESMTAADFAGLPCESGVLTGEEQAAILRIAAGKHVEHGFKKKAQRQGINCRNWKAGQDYHIYCSQCYRYVCRDCFAAGIGNAIWGACSTCRSNGKDVSYHTTLTKVSRDRCAGYP